MADSKPRRGFLRSSALRIVLVAVVVLSVGSCFGLREVSRRMVFPAPHRPVTNLSPSSTAPLATVVEYRADDGVKLEGVIVHPETATKDRVVLYFHGNGECVQDEIPFAQNLASDLRVDVFLAEYRGYGGSDGSPSEPGLFLDGRAAVRATGRAPDQIIVAGWSLGTGVAVELAHEGVGRSMVLLAPYASMVSAARHLMRNPETIRQVREHLGSFGGLMSVASAIVDSPVGGWVIPDHFASEVAIRDVKIPIFIVHSTDDSIVPFADGQALSTIAPHATLFTLQNQDHFVEGAPETKSAFRAALSVN